MRYLSVLGMSFGVIVLAVMTACQGATGARGHADLPAERRSDMKDGVFSVWETWLRPGAEEEGVALTRRIWADMRQFRGYVGHRLLRDLDAPGHLLVVSRWETRDLADATLAAYRGAEPVQRMGPLLAQPRSRWVLIEDNAGGDP
jgi:quinol monooxygenase YgiN